MTEIFPKWFKLLFALALLSGVVLFLFSIGTLVKLFIIAVVLSYILNPLVNNLESRGLSRNISTAIIFSGVITLLITFIILLLPLISGELQSIQSSFSEGTASAAISKIEKKIEGVTKFLGVENLNIMDRLRETISKVGGKLFSYLLDAFSLITNMILIPFFMFFLLKDAREFNKQLIALVPNRYFEVYINLLNKTDIQLGNYMRGQFAESLIVGTLAITVLTIMEVKYAFVIGLFVGLTNLIPYIGPLIGAIPAVLVSLFDTGDLKPALYVALALLFVQLADNLILKPLVVARAVNIHPMMVLLVVIIGGKFFGILGMLLSIPFTAIIQLVLKESIIVFRKYRLT